MRRKHHFPIMVQAITVLTVLRMLADAQTTCNGGNGRLTYECIRGYQLQGFDDDTFSSKESPIATVEACRKQCLSDRTTSNQLVRTCKSFDFIPGIANPLPGSFRTFDESKCYLSRDTPKPEGIGQLAQDSHSSLYVENCLTSSRVEKECPNRLSVFDVLVRKHFKISGGSLEIPNVNRTECQNRCLNEYKLVCRSATFMQSTRTCILNDKTFRMFPEYLTDNADAIYMENTCLSVEKRCEGKLVFIKEEHWELGGPFDFEIHNNVGLEDCLAKCLLHEKIYCRSVEYNNETKTCVLSEEDSYSQLKEMRQSRSKSTTYFELMCLDGSRSSDNSDNAVDTSSGTSHLFDGRRRDILTAFQRYRNSRLRADYQTEIQHITLAECLDECLKQTSYRCLSVMFRERDGRCLLSRFDQRSGNPLQYDTDHDYYENLMVDHTSSAPFANNGPPLHNNRPNDKFNSVGNQNRPFSGANNNDGSLPHNNWGSNAIGGNNAYNPYPPAGSSSSSSYGQGSYYGQQPASGGSYYGGGPAAPPIGGHNTYYQPTNNIYGNTGVGSTAGSNYFGGAPAGGIRPPNSVYGGKPSGTAFANCNEANRYRQIGLRQRIRRPYVRRFITSDSVYQCEKECNDVRDFICRSFNFRLSPSTFNERDNCELSDRDTRDLDMRNPSFFEVSGDYDFYERQQMEGDCLDVSQTCSEEGMEFKVRMPEGFRGRIYSHGYYDRCFVRGNGDQVAVLRLSGPHGYPDCGTAKVLGETLTNIVVVQFSDSVQTGKDKRYNLTCMSRGPGEAIVTSGYIGAGSGSPTPIEYLPAENTISNRVRLSILYQGRPTTTIAVGDPLTFRIDTQDGQNYASDLFASNVIAKDPYTGRAVQLIDRYGCPVDYYVFPALDRAREGDGLEARFFAFKIPDSNFLVFEANVKTCRGGCQAAYCPGPAGREEPSFGRRKREIENNTSSDDGEEEVAADVQQDPTNDEEHVREMIQVFTSRLEMPEEGVKSNVIPNVCLSNSEYYGLVSALVIVVLLMVTFTIVAGYIYRRHRLIQFKNYVADSNAPQPRYMSSTSSITSPVHTSTPHRAHTNLAFLGLDLQKSLEPRRYVDEPSAVTSDLPNPTIDSPIPASSRRRFEVADPSEPIYTDPSLFERSRSLRSIAASDFGQIVNNENC